MSHITTRELQLWQAQGLPHTLLDVRRAEVRQAQGVDIAGTVWRDPAAWLDWKDSIPTDAPVVVVCAKGHEISQALTTALAVLGADARFLVGGIAGWIDENRAVRPIGGGTGVGPNHA